VIGESFVTEAAEVLDDDVDVDVVAGVVDAGVVEVGVVDVGVGVVDVACELVCATVVDVGVVDVDPPMVPEAAALRATYPKRPLEALPQYSDGYPGQVSSQELTETVSAGA